MRSQFLFPEQKSQPDDSKERLKMSAVVADARKWAHFLVRSETRGVGDLDRAMTTVARRCGVTASLIRSLHYRPPKDIWAGCYFNLAAAYQAECERQAKLLEHELAITAAKAGSSAHLVRAAAALAGAPLGERRERD